MSRFFLSYLSRYKKQHKKRYKKRTFLFNKNTMNYIHYNKYSYSGASVIVYCNKEFLLPRNFLFKFKKTYRKFFKKRKIRCFIYFRINYILSSKSKNSRMGKGVGSFDRFSTRCYQGRPMFYFKNTNIRRVDGFLLELSKNLNTSFYTFDLKSKKIYFHNNNK